VRQWERPRLYRVRCGTGCSRPAPLRSINRFLERRVAWTATYSSFSQPLHIPPHAIDAPRHSLNRFNDLVEEYCVVMRESNVEPLDRVNDLLLLLCREMESGSCHKVYRMLL